MRKLLPTLSAVALLAGLTAPAAAAPVFDTFGELPGATFGGSGIPTDSVAITEYSLGGGVVLTLGLTATPRFSNPALTNDGAGTFFANTGFNDGLVGSPTLGATWNISFYAGLSSGTFADYSDLEVALLYDTSPNLSVDIGFLNLTAALAAFGDPSATGLIQGSQNLTFGFLNSGPALPGSFLPSSPFDPLAAGVYGVALVADDAFGSAISSIDVIVSTVPLPGALVIFGSGLLLLGLRRRAIV